MKSIKIATSALAGSALWLVALALIPVEARALPFAENCASMEKYFNSTSVKFPNKTSFSGFASARAHFENFPNGTYALCQGGYVTETSPMGTRVCVGGISYQESSGGAMYHIDQPAKDNCRWKN